MEQELTEFIRDPRPYDGELSRAERYIRINEGTYPKPVKFGPQLNAWRKSDLIQYQQEWLAKSEALSADARAAMAKATAARHKKSATASRPAGPSRQKEAA